jgi:pyruvate/2-oxoacid:ferredoxin oxidoreductase alpha subunit
MAESMDKAIAIAELAACDWSRIEGRNHDILEEYRCAGADLVLVTMGGPAGTCREAVDSLRQEGIKAGMLKVRLFRPFPAKAIRAALTNVPVVAVLDRNYSVGMGGILHQEIKAAISGVSNLKIHGFLLGVGGTDVDPELIIKAARQALEEPGSSESVWMR